MNRFAAGKYPDAFSAERRDLTAQSWLNDIFSICSLPLEESNQNQETMLVSLTVNTLVDLLTFWSLWEVLWAFMLLTYDYALYTRDDTTLKIKAGK
jgi:hypothetical protein